MATPRAPSNRAKTAALAAAGLILIGTFLGWRMAQRPAAAGAASVTQPRRQPAPAPSASADEPARVAASKGRVEAAPNTAAARPTALEPGGRERERLAFVRRLNTADARSTLGPGIPLAVAEMIGAGRLREASNTLLQLGRDGDANGYHALEQLLGTCPGPGDDRDSERRALDRKARNQQMINGMERAGASKALLDRLQWSLDAGNAFFRGIWAEFCPGGEAGDYRSLLDEVHGVLPRPAPSKYEEQLRNAVGGGPRPEYGVIEAHEREWTEHTRRRAEAGVIASQVQRATGDLFRGDPAQKAAAFAVLRSLAPVSLQARAELAKCARLRCTPEADDADGARQLALEAARAGSVEGLDMVGSSRFGLIEDTAELYAWSQVRHELYELGCFGFSGFSYWAFRHALSREAALREMSPREADLAQGRAKELVATEVPAIRARLGCS